MFFEFHSICCLVRDVVTKQVLLSGSESGSIYKLDFSQMCAQTRYMNMECNVSADCHRSCNESSKNMSYFFEQIKIHSSNLHQRLGHPSSNTLALIIKKIT